MIIAGGGVHYSEAWDALAAFSEACGIPVGETFGGKGAMREILALGHRRFRGHRHAGRRQDRRGGRPGHRSRNEAYRFLHRDRNRHSSIPDVRFIGINIAGHDAYKQGALPVTADAQGNVDRAGRSCPGGRHPARRSLPGGSKAPRGRLRTVPAGRSIHRSSRRGDEPGQAHPDAQRRGTGRATASSPPRGVRRGTCTGSGT